MFDIDTQIRQVVMTILEPQVDRMNNNSNDLKELKKVTDGMQKAIDEMDRYLKNDLNLKTFLTDLRKRQSLIVSVIQITLFLRLGDGLRSI